MHIDTNRLVPEPAIWQAQLPGRPLSGLTVLVVEDSRFASEAIRLLCLRSGARIRRADCLAAAMRHLQTYRPNIVLVDMGLPDGSGADLIRQIATREFAPLVLGISGDPDTKDAAMAAGAVAFIAKPINSLAAFQQTILAALPPENLQPGPRLLPNEIVTPDTTALRDDLAHVADVLSNAVDNRAIDYIARFLTGVARSAQDTPLAEAAAALARDHEAGRGVATDLTRISGMVHERLAAVGHA
ncbi:MAG: response regulator [Paracoccus denitrificans]|uniref:Response regulator n=1 Tax=Paracoccus denitrificans TaxID=266 RepID=A0A533I7W5_PARDE|nr:MAG: response regulator [Paracoccus denitrificans]